jgi:hypothetical protein
LPSAVWAGPAQWTGEGSHSFSDVSYDVCVYILEEDLDRQVLGRRVQRQARAIIETLCRATRLAWRPAARRLRMTY